MAPLKQPRSYQTTPFGPFGVWGSFEPDRLEGRAGAPAYSYDGTGTGYESESLATTLSAVEPVMASAVMSANQPKETARVELRANRPDGTTFDAMPALCVSMWDSPCTLTGEYETAVVEISPLLDPGLTYSASIFAWANDRAPDSSASGRFEMTLVPEPVTDLLVASGLGALALRARPRSP